MNRSPRTFVTVANTVRFAWLAVLVAASGCDAFDQLFSSQGECNTLRVFPSPLSLRVGDSIRLGSTLRDRDNRPVRCVGGNASQWISADSSVARVDGTGLVTGVSAGTTTVTGRLGTLSASSVVRVSAP